MLAHLPVTKALQVQAGNMKKLLKYLGFGLLSVIIFFVAIFAITSVGGIDKEEVFVPFIESSVPKLSTWDIDTYKALMSEKGMEAATEKQWNLYLTKFSRLGTLKSVGIPELQNSQVMSTVATGTTTHAIYLVPLEFDTGSAHVQLMLQHNNDKVEINGVKYLSDLLLQ